MVPRSSPANRVEIARPVVLGLGSNGKSLCLWLKNGETYVRKEMDKDAAVDLATRILIEVRALARLDRATEGGMDPL